MLVCFRTAWFVSVIQGFARLSTDHTFGNEGAPTSLHTRISARVLLRWVSPLPAETILDCVLDDNWKNNGVIRWCVVFCAGTEQN